MSITPFHTGPLKSTVFTQNAAKGLGVTLVVECRIRERIAALDADEE
jgi:hypothetical protein